MKLDGAKIEQIQNAFLDAFNESSLQQMCKIHLDEYLFHIVSRNANFKKVVFDLIGWAERFGRVNDLLSGARKANPGNQMLADLEIGFDNKNLQSTWVWI